MGVAMARDNVRVQKQEYGPLLGASSSHSFVLTKFLHEFPKITGFGKHAGVLALEVLQRAGLGGKIHRENAGSKCS